MRSLPKSDIKIKLLRINRHGPLLTLEESGGELGTEDESDDSCEWAVARRSERVEIFGVSTRSRILCRAFNLYYCDKYETRESKGSTHNAMKEFTYTRCKETVGLGWR